MGAVAELAWGNEKNEGEGGSLRPSQAGPVKHFPLSPQRVTSLASCF